MSKFGSEEPVLHDYHGVKYTSHFKPNVIEKIGQAEFDPSDIIVATYPKAGTNWMMAIVNLILTKGETTDTFSFLEFHRSTKAMCEFDEEMQKSPPRRFMTHLQFKFLEGAFKKSKPRVICMMRNPCDNLVSFYHFTRMNASLGLYQGSWDEFFEEIYKQDKLCFGSYFDHVEGWWEARKTNSDHILYVKYEDLCQSPCDVIIKVATFLGHTLDEDLISTILEKSSFDKMKEEPKFNKTSVPYMKTDIVPFMRKGKVGDWKNYLSDSQFEYIDKLCKEKLVLKGLEFQYDFTA